MASPVLIVLVVPGCIVVFSMLEISIPADPEVLLIGKVACGWSFLNFAVEVEQTSVFWRKGEDIVVVKRLC